MKKRLMAMGLIVMVCMPVSASEVQAAEFGVTSDWILASADNADGNNEVDLAEMFSGVKDQIEEALEQIDAETAEEIFGFVKEKIADGSLETEEGLDAAIQEGEEKFKVTIDKATAGKVVETMEKLEKMGFSGEELVEKAQGLYEEYGADFIDHANEAITEVVEDAVSNAVSSFWDNLWKDTKNFFSNLFSGF